MQSEPVVYVVDDDASVRHSLRFLLESAGLPTAVFQSADEFLAAEEERYGCILTDVRMPGTSGLDLQERLRQLGDPTPVIVITGHGDVPIAVRAMKAGALDFIEKPFNDESMLEKVRRGLELAAARRQNTEGARQTAQRLSTLSPRERQVFTLVVTGYANKQVAAELGIAEKTVEIHRANVMRKTGARSLAELVRLHVSASAEPRAAANKTDAGFQAA